MIRLGIKSMSTPRYVKIMATDARQAATIELAITKFSKNKFALALNQVDIELIDGDSIQGHQYISEHTFNNPYVIMSVNPTQFEHPFTIAKPLKPETLFKALTECLEKTAMTPTSVTAPFSQGIQYLQQQKIAKSKQHKVIQKAIQQEKPESQQPLIQPQQIQPQPEILQHPLKNTLSKQTANEKTVTAPSVRLTAEEVKTAKRALHAKIVQEHSEQKKVIEIINKTDKESAVSDIRDLSLSRLISMQKQTTKPDLPNTIKPQATRPTHDPVFVFEEKNVSNERPAEMDEAVYFGNLPEINANDLAVHNGIGFFNFEQHLAYHITNILFSTHSQAEIQDKVIAFNIDGSSIFLSKKTDICYTTLNGNSLHAFAISPFPHAPYYTLHTTMNDAFNHYGKQKPANKMSAQLFLSQITLLAAKGRLPRDTDLNKKISIIHQPDISKLVPIPGAIRVFSLWNMVPTSLLETCKIIGLPQKYVFSIYLIALVSGVLKNDTETNEVASNKTPPRARNSDLNDLLNHINSL